MKEKPVKRPMTEEELTAISMLRGVTFAVASWDKRAAKHLFDATTLPPEPECDCGLAETAGVLELSPIAIGRKTHLPTCAIEAYNNWQPMISEKMAPQLWRILFRYRRQLRHPERAKYVRMAETRRVPDYRTYEYRKAQEAKYKIEKLKREAAQKEAV